MVSPRLFRRRRGRTFRPRHHALLGHHPAAHHSALHHLIHHAHTFLHLLAALFHGFLTFFRSRSAHHPVVQCLHLLHVLVHLRHRGHGLSRGGFPAWWRGLGVLGHRNRAG